MKAIIVSVLSAIIAVTAIATPASAETMGDGFYLSANGGTTIDSWSKMGIKNGKFYIEGEMVMCSKTNVRMGGQMTTGDAKVNRPVPNMPSADVSCSANDVINDPPAGATVTINNVCGDAAEIAKIKASNANLIINSIGPCPTDGRKPAKPTIVDVKYPSDTKVTAASAKNTGNGDVTLPETGLSDITLISAGLAALAYGATFAIRAFRARG